MSHTQVNIMVYVKQAISGESGEALVDELGGIRGVSRAWVSTRLPRIVLVDFDPMLTDTQRILGTVVRCGFDARLVGM